MANVTHHEIEINGLATHYVRSNNEVHSRGNARSNGEPRSGVGTPVIVIHGGAPGACAMVNWSSNIGDLGDTGLDVIAFDQPGYGRTANPADYSMDYRIEHAKAFIDALGLTQFHVMGNSQGAYLAARIALDDPRVQRLVLVSSGTLAPPGSAEAQAISREHSRALGAYEPGLENMRKLSMGTLYNKELVTDAFVQLRYEMSIGRLHEASIERRKAPRPEPIFGELGNMRPPTMLLSGLHDAGVTVERTMSLFQLFPHAELHVFSDAAHWVQWDQAERFNALVSAFLA